MDDREDQEPKSVAQRATAAGAGALFGSAVGGGMLGAAAGAAAGPALEPLLARVWEELRIDTWRRGEAVLHSAMEELGDEPQNLEQRIVSTEQGRLLTAIATNAGMRTVWHPKLRALGRALAAGLAGDGAKLDEQQFILSALADLEAPHALVVDLLATKIARQTPREKGAESRFVAVDRTREQSCSPWTAEQIGSVLPNLVVGLSTILGTLQRHGLALARYDLSDVTGNLVADNGDGTLSIDTDTGPQEPVVTWTTTELGLILHELLRDAPHGQGAS